MTELLGQYKAFFLTFHIGHVIITIKHFYISRKMIQINRRMLSGMLPIRKNRNEFFGRDARGILKQQRKGKTPMEKNVFVVDEQGNLYSATWAKRAKGLVKKGRARFVNETTICLACPPNQSLEDISMDYDTASIEQDNIVSEVSTMEEQAVSEKQMTISDILLKVDEIRNDLKYLDQVVAQIKDSDAPKNVTLKDIVTCRETTYQKMMEFYTKVYDDIRHKSAADEKKEFITGVLSSIPTVPGAVVDFPGVIAELCKYSG